MDSLKKEASEKIKLSIFNIGENIISTPLLTDVSKEQLLTECENLQLESENL